ncbi:DnaJ domain-containing protein [Aestuariivirga sp.]|uniref:DnaJ domain-containing protein n=1 Tax=Aestuariivirga sp. TaxID=2650926 RepID=UPI0039E2D435
MNLLIALVIVVGGWMVLRKLGNSKPPQVRALIRQVSGWALVAAGAVLSMRGALNIGAPLAMLGLGLVGENSLFAKNIPGARRPQAPPPGQKQQTPPPRGRITMSAKEAYSVLGLKEGSGADDVRSAHRRLMKDFHPDKGGTDYLAAKINEAKDVLLQELGATT